MPSGDDGPIVEDTMCREVTETLASPKGKSNFKPINFQENAESEVRRDSSDSSSDASDDKDVQSILFEL